jgi:hypothetical protein
MSLTGPSDGDGSAVSVIVVAAKESGDFRLIRVKVLRGQLK